MKEIKIFFTAVMFYTRIPCPSWVDHSEEYLNRATKYFPLIGWIVGIGAALVLIGAQYIFSPIPSLILSLAASVLITGAFHEDGFADVCDGFGGGWTKEKILDIMKDSRVGTFAVVGLLLLFLFKIFVLHDILFSGPFDLVFTVFVFAGVHALSRFIASTFVLTHEYVRENDLSKAKPIAKSYRAADATLASVFAITPLVLLSLYFQKPWAMAVVIPGYMTKMWLGRYFKKWIGGYTGDCLGATQQITEVVLYASILIVWKFT